MGIEDPRNNAHAPNGGLHQGDWFKLMASLAHLFRNLGDLPRGHSSPAHDLEEKPALPRA